jgi:hypothetical protein
MSDNKHKADEIDEMLKQLVSRGRCIATYSSVETDLLVKQAREELANFIFEESINDCQKYRLTDWELGWQEAVKQIADKIRGSK